MWIPKLEDMEDQNPEQGIKETKVRIQCLEDLEARDSLRGKGLG